MITRDMAQSLAEKLPWVAKDLTKDKYSYLFFKWGAYDGDWKSTKVALRIIPIGLERKDAIALETHVANVILEKLKQVYACPSCSRDITKSGVRASQYGIRSVDGYLSQNGGYFNRTTNEEFTKHTSGSSEPELDKFFCKACGHLFEEDSVPYILIREGVRHTTSLKIGAKLFGTTKEFSHKNMMAHITNTYLSPESRTKTITQPTDNGI